MGPLGNRDIPFLFLAVFGIVAFNDDENLMKVGSCWFFSIDHGDVL
jgi:hypothetical protein